jgi:hypothetical protein
MQNAKKAYLKAKEIILNKDRNSKLIVQKAQQFTDNYKQKKPIATTTGS